MQALLFYGPLAPPDILQVRGRSDAGAEAARGRRARFHDRHKAKRLPGVERAPGVVIAIRTVWSGAEHGAALFQGGRSTVVG